MRILKTVASVHGEIDHSTFYNDGESASGWWGGDTSVRRSVFMGDYVYAFSGAGVSATSFADMNTTSTLELPGFEPAETYYYEDVAVSEEESRENPPIRKVPTERGALIGAKLNGSTCTSWCTNCFTAERATQVRL